MMQPWPRIAKLLPLLGSDKDGEVLATVAAIARILEASSSNWHELAKTIGGPDPTRSTKTDDALMSFLAGLTSLSDSEANFVSGCQKHIRRRPLSERQREVLESIAERHGWKP
jgi:hypothetical protein